MAPAIPDGAILTITPATAETIRLGDVVLYETPDGRTVCHRLLARRHTRQSGPTLGFRGDAFTAPLEWIPGTGVIGKAMACDLTRLDNGFNRWAGWFHAWGYWMISRARIKLGGWRRRLTSHH